MERPSWYNDAPYRFKNLHGEHWAARIIDGRLEITGCDIDYKIWSPPPLLRDPDRASPVLLADVPREMWPLWNLTHEEELWVKSVVLAYVRLAERHDNLADNGAWARWGLRRDA